MRKLERSISIATYDKEESVEDFLRYLVSLSEETYENIAGRVNWLMTVRFEAHTLDDCLELHEGGSYHTNRGATGTITLTLPAATRSGVIFHFACQEALTLRIEPGSAAIRDDSGQTAGKYKYANAIGACLSLVSDANGDWVTFAKNGTWSEEA